MSAYVCSSCRARLSPARASSCCLSRFASSLKTPHTTRSDARSLRSLSTSTKPAHVGETPDGQRRRRDGIVRSERDRGIQGQSEKTEKEFLLKLFNKGAQRDPRVRSQLSRSDRHPSTIAAPGSTIGGNDASQAARLISAADEDHHEAEASSTRPTRAPQGRRGHRINSLRVKLARCLESRDLRGLETLWHETRTASVEATSTQNEAKTPATAYDQFLMAFLSLGLSDRAIEVWNHRAERGIAPSIATWDAMLRGSAVAKDAEALKNVWAMMLRTGTKPDKHVWATKIHGLATMGHWRSAFETFEEMADAWMQEVQANGNLNVPPDLQSLGDINGVLKPDVRALNALLSALARANQFERVAKALAMASSLGIEMDIYSFNSLLLLASRSNSTDMMDKFLEQMRLADIKPDAATYTIILDSIYRGEESPGQEIRAAEVLNEMVRSGIEANSWVYSTLIKSLLKAKGNLAGAQAVVNHMDRQKIPVNTHIFTAFATHYFGQSPPNIVAIENLWNRALSTGHISGSRLDVIFFDRMIEGFAKHDEIGKATIGLAEASKRGIIPGWLAMTELLRALARIGDRRRMRELVAEALGEEMASGGPRAETTRGAVKHDFGRKQFLESAQELGLLDRTDVS